jgi:glycine betaine catabolism A
VTRFPKPAEGSWTQHYPHLGTTPVSYLDSVSPAWFELEKEAIFRRAWLHVGRVEQVPRAGSYFTRELLAAGTSIIVARRADGEVRAFHNLCRHRGNKLVWNDYPHQETSGIARQFACKYHGWRYGLDGACTFVQQQDEFFDLERADYGLVPVHCDTFAGFIFVNVAPEPGQSLKEFLGPMVGNIEGYPFSDMTDQYLFNVDCRSNWKVFADSLLEFYHAPVLHLRQHPGALHTRISEAGFEAPHYQLDGPHRMVSTSGAPRRVWPPDYQYPIEHATRSGLFGPWNEPDLGDDLPGVNPGKIAKWAVSNFQIFPNLEILIWETGWYQVHRYWPLAHNRHRFEGTLYFTPSKTASDRAARECAAVMFKEFGLQDVGTLVGTQRALESRAALALGASFPLNDQEILVRHLHKTIGEWVDAYRRQPERAGRV